MSIDRSKKVAVIDNLIGIDTFNLGEKYISSSKRMTDALGGNTGNIAFVDGAFAVIGDDKMRIGWGSAAAKVNEFSSRLVICCANQLGKHTDLGSWADHLERINLPVVLLGLGAQTDNYESEVELTDGTRRFLDVVSKLKAGSGPNIGVRGAFTKNILKQFDFDSVVTGCPSLFLNKKPSLGALISAKSCGRKLAVAGGNPFHASSRELERKLASMVFEYDGAYIVQHPKDMISLALGESIDEGALNKITSWLGFADAQECCNWFKKRGYVFSDSKDWRYFLSHFDVVLGPRYHGVALGVQAEMSGLVIHIDNRTKELAETTGIKSISVSEALAMTVDELRAAAIWTKDDGVAFDKNRALMAGALAKFMSDNMIAPAPYLNDIAAVVD